ncbi:MAG: nuclear transport factor 2 family protein [Afipia sp.]
MSNQQSEQCVRTFIDAFYAGDAARMEQCCDDAFTSLVYAPVEVFPHLGLKQGKAWVAKAIQIQQERYSSRRHIIDFVVANETHGAAFVQANLTKRSDQRIIRLNIGEFFTLRSGRIAEHRSLFDSFDLVQQLIGDDMTGEFAMRVKNAMRQ